MKNPTTPEQIASVCDELHHLIDIWADGEIEERDIRAGSGILRRLLVHSELNKVWNALVGEERFLIPTTAIKIEHPELIRFYDLYTCSEVKHKGSTIFTTQAYTGKTTMTPLGNGKFRDDTPRGARIESKDLTLNQFMDSICIIAEGKQISRSWVIQYVANSLGGSHFGSKSKKGLKFDTAMAKLKQFDVGDMPASVREILGIAQAICKSDSTKILMKAYSDWRKENPKVRIA